MSLKSYAEVRPWARAIRSSVLRREMPPFSVAGPIGRYVDDPRLTDAEIELITAWVDQGAAGGNLTDEAASADLPGEADDWVLGPPDLVLRTQPYQVGSGPRDNYTLHLIDYVFPEETWVGAFEIKHLNYSLVHHSALFVYSPSKRVRRQVARQDLSSLPYHPLGDNPTGKQVDFLLPGQTPRMLRPGEVRALPKGTRLALQNHYAPMDEPAVSESLIGVYFFDGVIAESIEEFHAPPPEIQIAPGDPHYERRYEHTFDQDVVIYYFRMHMHLRGKSGLLMLTYPDGRSERVFEVPRYDFDWQRIYRLADPLLVPSGTQVTHVGVWDNSAGNPDNPDFGAVVRAGFNSDDEMWVSAIGYSKPAVPITPIYIKQGRRIDVEDTQFGTATARQSRLVMR